jgi:membrane protein DedA with SNARE-associated domain
MMIDLQSRATRRVALTVFAVAALSTLWFGLRTHGSFLLLRSAYEAGAPRTSSIRAWMTLDYVAASYRVPATALTERLGLPPETDAHANLKSLAESRGESPYPFVQEVQRAVADAAAANPNSDRTRDSSGWLGAVGDEVLTALLVYGYPALGLTLLLGAMGLPLPGGLAATIAGSLAAQGRMNWIWAGVVIATASVIGDAVAYAVGRVLGREILEHHGRWFGYTPARRVRAQRLFERWGTLTVFVTRTFVSHLSAIASVLAGMSRYPLGKYLPVTVAGRAAWTAAYFGLGYIIGGDLEAAAGFLANLSGFLLSAIVLVLTGSIAMGRAGAQSASEVA